MSEDPAAGWEAIGQTHPFFGVLPEERYRGLTLSPERRAEFYASGRPDIDHTLDLLRRHFAVPERFDHGLDFGCGVGRLLHAMRDHCDALSGVDVSRAMMRQAKRAVPDARYSTDIPDGPVDWINSLIVFQHILPARGMELLDQLLAACAPDAALSLHVTVEIVPDRATERPGSVGLFAYDLPTVLRRLSGAGFATVHTEYLDHGQARGVRLISARGTYRGRG